MSCATGRAGRASRRSCSRRRRTGSRPRARRRTRRAARAASAGRRSPRRGAGRTAKIGSRSAWTAGWPVTSAGGRAGEGAPQRARVALRVLQVERGVHVGEDDAAVRARAGRRRPCRHGAGGAPTRAARPSFGGCRKTTVNVPSGRSSKCACRSCRASSESVPGTENVFASSGCRRVEARMPAGRAPRTTRRGRVRGSARRHGPNAPAQRVFTDSGGAAALSNPLSLVRPRRTRLSGARR